jgi:hypothetical protein
MNGKLKISTKRQLALGIVLLLGAGAASAFPCGVGYVDGNKTATPLTNPNGAGDDFACLNGPVNDNNDSAADLNAGSFFGRSDWVFYDKIDPPTEGAIGGNSGILKISDLETSGGAVIAGNWEFLLANFWTAFDDALIVLKDGGVNVDSGCRGNCDSYFWSAYHVTNGEIDGNWAMDRRNLSHISLYTHPGINPPTPPDEPVPEPGILSLLGAGLLGMRAKFRKAVSV